MAIALISWDVTPIRSCKYGYILYTWPLKTEVVTTSSAQSISAGKHIFLSPTSIERHHNLWWQYPANQLVRPQVIQSFAVDMGIYGEGFE